MSEQDRSLIEALDRALTKMQAGAQPGAPGMLEVEPLIRTAADLQAALAPADPTPAYVAATKARLANRLGAAQGRARRAAQPRTRRPQPAWRWAFALASVVATVALVAAGTGVAYAAREALPGDTLYGVKRGLEEVRLALPSSPENRASLLGAFADERISEAEALAAAGREADLGLALGAYQDDVQRMTDLAGQLPADQGSAQLEAMRTQLEHHIQVLQRVQGIASPNAQGAIDEAIVRSSHGEQVIAELQKGGKPSDLAPGQATPTPTDQPGGRGRGKNKTPGPPPWVTTGPDDFSP